MDSVHLRLHTSEMKTSKPSCIRLGPTGHDWKSAGQDWKSDEGSMGAHIWVLYDCVYMLQPQIIDYPAEDA